MKRTVLAAILALVTLHAPACWAAKVQPADGVTFTTLALYGQGFSAPSNNTGDSMTGMTLGGYVCLDWNDTGEAIRKGKVALGFATEFALGLGLAQDGRSSSTQGSAFVFDLTADLLGVIARYKPIDHLEFGLFYEPVEAYLASVAWILGSKMELKAGYKEFQINLARAGNGFVSGFLLPKEGQAIHSLSLQYRAPNELLYGIQYTNLPNSSATRPGGHALMVQFGYWG